MTQSRSEAAPSVGPFSIIDADSRTNIQKNRVGRLAVAFDRLDRYLLRSENADALIVDVFGRPVPRPHPPLPSQTLGGLPLKERRRAFRRSIWLASSGVRT